MVLLALIQVILFGWVIGTRRGLNEAHKGSAIRIPTVFGFIIKFVTPSVLIAIFGAWIFKTLLGVGGGSEEIEVNQRVADLFLEPNAVSWLGICIIALLFLFGVLNLPLKQEVRTHINRTEKKGDGI